MTIQDLSISLDTVWMLLAAMLVFFMQPGFALCEAGFTRSKNTANILFKNFVDFMFGSLLFWLVGFGFMFGSNGEGFIGMPHLGISHSIAVRRDCPQRDFSSSRPCFVPHRQPLCLERWQNAPSSLCIACIPYSSPCSSIPSPATGHGAEAGSATAMREAS